MKMYWLSVARVQNVAEEASRQWFQWNVAGEMHWILMKFFKAVLSNASTKTTTGSAVPLRFTELYSLL